MSSVTPAVQRVLNIATCGHLARSVHMPPQPVTGFSEGRVQRFINSVQEIASSSARIRDKERGPPALDGVAQGSITLRFKRSARRVSWILEKIHRAAEKMSVFCNKTRRQFRAARSDAAISVA
jgi:hypothetical protein